MRETAYSFDECWVEQNISLGASRAFLLLVAHSKETGVSAMLAKSTPFPTNGERESSNSNARKALTLLEPRAESLGFYRVADGKGPNWYASRFRKK